MVSVLQYRLMNELPAVCHCVVQQNNAESIDHPHIYSVFLVLHFCRVSSSLGKNNEVSGPAWVRLNP